MPSKLERHAEQLSALGHPVRLAILRFVVQSGDNGAATGRMTIVFRRVGKDWKAIHLHTSPDKPDATRVMPSEHDNQRPHENLYGQDN